MNTKKGYITNIERDSIKNNFFRKVLYTGEYLQLVLMSLKPGEDIGKEVHEHNDQFIRIEKGRGRIYLNGEEREVSDGDSILIPAGAEHNLTNIGEEELKLYTLYGPAEHRDGVIHKTKNEAEQLHEEDHFDGKYTEE